MPQAVADEGVNPNVCMCRIWNGGSMLIPAFHRLEAEAAVIGRIMSGFGELELSLGYCVYKAVGRSRDDVLMEIFNIRNARHRINHAEGTARKQILELQIDREFTRTVQQVRACLGIRNDYSHCHWADQRACLYYTKLEEAAKTNGFQLKWRQVDLNLLSRQEVFCMNTREWLLYLEYEIEYRLDSRKQSDLEWHHGGL
jgi:hypothetical protein